MYKATTKFKELGPGSSFQGLSTDIFKKLKKGEKVNIKKVPKRLIEDGYLKKVITKKNKKEEKSWQ